MPTKTGESSFRLKDFASQFHFAQAEVSLDVKQ